MKNRKTSNILQSHALGISFGKTLLALAPLAGRASTTGEVYAK